MKTKVTVLAIFSVMMVFVLSSFVPQTEGQKIGGPWNIPDTYKTKTNSFKSDKSLEAVGKTLYAKHCRSCHGNVGLGDGPKSKGLKTFPGKFNDEKFQAHSDGELYYMSFIGRDEMPNFEAKIPEEEDRWAVIMYMRTLK